ncbi:MAG: LysR family transcriptional regulator [Gammaproteobacteria bacterium]|nr:LysR family transcriptional regulator [Gammaproteobacteria bacterium]
MNLPTDLLRTFVTITDLGSFTRAGDKLGRSQPAISLQIKRLEDMLKTRLYERSSRDLVLSHSGRQLTDYARKMLAINDEAVVKLLQQDVEGSVHLGIPNEFAASRLFPEVLSRFSQSYSQVQLQVTCDLSVNLLNRLKRNSFDLVLALHDSSDSGYYKESWFEEIVWVCGPDSNASQREPIPLIVAPEGCIYRQRMIEALDTIGKPWHIVYTSQNYGGIRAGVMAGLGVTALARNTVSEGMIILGSAERMRRLQQVELGLHYDAENASIASRRLAEFISMHYGGK